MRLPICIFVPKLRVFNKILLNFQKFSTKEKLIWRQFMSMTFSIFGVFPHMERLCQNEVVKANTLETLTNM